MICSYYTLKLIMNQITIRNFEVPWRFKNFSSLHLNFPLRNSNEAMQAHPLTTSGPAPFTVHAHHAAQTVIAPTTRWLQYWKKNQAKFPNLIILVKKYLCIQASSTEAERSFSALANLLTKRRLRMSGENVNKQLFLREAIKKLCLLKSLS